jgi:sulfate/thiosulfate transport system substrate-binding protein
MSQTQTNSLFQCIFKTGGLLCLAFLVWLLGSRLQSTQWALSAQTKQAELLNVSYDPTRELWKDMNRSFVQKYSNDKGVQVEISQSHGGSSSQARSVIDGLDADVVTLALWNDIDAISKAGLINPGWEQRLPNNSSPYYSTIVFVVRKGNPLNIRDWPDLVRDGIKVITPSPKTSGNGKLSFLAAWGSVINAGGKEKQAEEYVRKLYQHTPVLDSGARAATSTFAHKHMGDVHLTWENEARLEVKESRGALELVYPPTSIRANPPVAWVDANVKRRGTTAAAEAYLRYLYSPEGQEILARHYYRPIDGAVAKKHAAEFPAIKMFSVSDISKGWAESNKRFFSDGGVFDNIYARK